jgi:hypothetical protein
LAVDADDEGGAIGAARFFGIGKRVGAALLDKNEVVGVHGVALLLALAVGRMRRVDVLADGIGEIELAGDKVLVVQDDLEVNMRRAARIQPG